MKNHYKYIVEKVKANLEEIAKVKAKPAEYLEALEAVSEVVEVFIEAAKDDVKRSEGQG